jgi:hypothetical protein
MNLPHSTPLRPHVRAAETIRHSALCPTPDNAGKPRLGLATGTWEHSGVPKRTMKCGICRAPFKPKFPSRQRYCGRDCYEEAHRRLSLKRWNKKGRRERELRSISIGAGDVA